MFILEDVRQFYKLSPGQVHNLLEPLNYGGSMFKFIFIFGLLSTTASVAKPMMNRKYDNVVKTIEQIATQYPEKAELINLGESDSGKDIIGIKIGHGDIPNLVVGTHHGNEYGSTELALEFAADVAENPIEGQTLFVIPVLNISGYDSRSREEVSGFTWYDPNRNYPGPCGTEGPFTLKSTQLLADFIDKENIVNSATIHTFYPAVVYPWGLSSHDLETPYMDTFQALASAATFKSQYQTGNSTEVIYPANGTYEDYAYWKFGVWSMLFEVGSSHRPDLSDLEELVRLNVPGLRRMFEMAPTERATDHDFKGECSWSLQLLDRHDE